MKTKEKDVIKALKKFDVRIKKTTGNSLCKQFINQYCNAGEGCCHKQKICGIELCIESTTSLRT